MPDVLDGLDCIDGELIGKDKINVLKNCYYGTEPSNPAVGLLWRSSVDEILRQRKAGGWDIVGPQLVDTWTPSITFGAGATGITYGGANAGRYVRTGNWVTITGRLILTSKGSDNGDAVIGGLPFTCKNDNGSYAAANVRLYNITFLNQWTAYVNINTKTIPLNEVAAATGVLTTLTDGNFADDSEVVIGATYETDD